MTACIAPHATTTRATQCRYSRHDRYCASADQELAGDLDTDAMKVEQGDQREPVESSAAGDRGHISDQTTDTAIWTLHQPRSNPVVTAYRVGLKSMACRYLELTDEITDLYEPPRNGSLRTTPPTKPKTHTARSPTSTTSPT